jgi:hypothetical protein
MNGRREAMLLVYSDGIRSFCIHAKTSEEDFKVAGTRLIKWKYAGYAGECP